MNDQERVRVVYKKRGETPLEALERLRMGDERLHGVALSYAGRLDPIAEGVQLVLVGEENKRREHYLGLDKEYVVDILWGVSTDTGDILGIPNLICVSPRCTDRVGVEIDLRKIDAEILAGFVGKRDQKYPMYSSKTVRGKPLWQYAREGEEVETPSHEIEIYALEAKAEWKENVLRDIIETIGKVTGDFRQDEIARAWEKIGEKTFSLTRLRVACSSGTYIRQLVADISAKVGVSACVFRLERTKVGEWEVKKDTSV